MRTVDERVARAPAQTMFQIAADVERWPELLRHYRYVRFRERMHGTGIVEMSANRPFGPLAWPTWWVSLMEVQHRTDGSQPAIRFRHIEGITRGMEVEWSFAPVTEGTLVTVLHLWNGPSWPLIGGIAARAVIGPVFVHGIASRTLAGLARAAERRQTSH
jgi:ribosome-associated toxin RatA of RatAB toxin-antitoxin module